VFTRIFTALGVAVLLMYLILVVQFGSFLDPLAILVSLPLSLIGVVLALWITGDTLNIMSLIGVILLMGIVAKNAILLIDFAKWSEEKGTPRRAAIVEAGRARLRPILMTTFALIAGMAAVALGHGEGADFRAPLGRAIIGGVITSTLLTLLVIPTLRHLDDFREWVAARFGHGSPPRPEGPAGPGETERRHRRSALPPNYTRFASAYPIPAPVSPILCPSNHRRRAAPAGATVSFRGLPRAASRLAG
jgi:HAE1 family hydrophobic/amphiphilic exporter-1